MGPNETEVEWRSRFYPIEVHLLDEVTGRRGVYSDEGWDDAPGSGVFEDFLWSEGNCACDCNRVDYLYGHDSPEAADDHAFNCTTRRIVIEKIVRLSDGTTIYSETD